MRVLLICPVFPPECAPAGIMIQELAMDLSAAGHEVRVITGWPNHPLGRLFPGFRRCLLKKEISKGIEVLRVWHTLPRQKSFLQRVTYWMTFGASAFWATLFGKRHDVIYSQTVPLIGPLLAFLSSWIRGTRFIFGIFDIYPETALEAHAIRPGLLFRMARALDTWVCSRARHIRVIGEAQKATLLRRGLPESKISVVPLWLDEKRIQSGSHPTSFRSENGIPADNIVVLYAGTIGRVSGAEVVLNVASKMKQDQNVLFLFVGEGALKQDLVARAASERLTNVRFLPFQPEARLGEMLTSADIGLVTLLPGAANNSLPSKVLGYLAAGLPVVASVDLQSDIAHYITVGRCGCVCPPQDVLALTGAIRRLLDPSVRAEAANSARAFFRKHFARATGTATCIELLTRVE